jgi:hypothetical protein
MAKLCVCLASLLVLGCSLEGNTSPDARDYQTPFDDAGPYPGFRDGGCDFGTSGTSGTEDTSGTSGGSCDTSGGADAAPAADATPACWDHTFEYDETNWHETVTSVDVSGSFTTWAEPPAAPSLTRGNDGVWRATLTIGPGSHSYKLIVNDMWIADPANPNTEPDGFEGVNSVIELCSVD